MKNETLQIRISPDLKEKLAILASEAGQTASEWIRDQIKIEWWTREKYRNEKKAEN